MIGDQVRAWRRICSAGILLRGRSGSCFLFVSPALCESAVAKSPRVCQKQVVVEEGEESEQRRCWGGRGRGGSGVAGSVMISITLFRAIMRGHQFKIRRLSFLCVSLLSMCV